MKWRKVKKQFKKDKHKYLGLNLVAQDSTGMNVGMVVSDVKIRPAGGKQVYYDFEAEPIQSKLWVPREEPKGYYSNHEFSATFDITIDTPTKDLKKLLNM